MKKNNRIKIVKQKNKYQKIIRILIILLVFAIVALAIVLRITDKPKEETTNREDDIKAMQEQAKEYLEDRTIPQHIYDFSKEYSGKTQREEIYKQLDIIVKYLPDLCSDLKQTDSSKYYSDNSEQIKKNLGIEDETDFVQLAEYLKENDLSGLTFDYCIYHAGSLVEEEIYSNFQIDFVYKNHEPVTFNMGVLNKYMYNKSVLKLMAN